MSTPPLRAPAAVGAVHPAVLDRRVRDLLLIGLTGLIPAVIGLGIIVAMPQASASDAALVIGGILALMGIGALVASSNYVVTVTLLALYLGLLDGPVKLGLPTGEFGHAAVNVLVLAVCAGAVMRLVGSGEPIKLPPLFGWVLAFFITVAIEAFNPKTEGILKVIGGFRQQLEWVPFFFFGYLLMRSKKRFRQFFLIVGACALANAFVASYQTAISPSQLASWGPGYRTLYQPQSEGGSAGHARVYASEGEARARPVGLGSDSGFSGGVGLLALPFCLALLATWRSRRRWIVVVLALGALVGVATGLGRLQVIGAALGVIAFLAFAAVGGRSLKRPLAALGLVAALAVPFGALFLTVVRSGTFSRYSTFENSSAASIATHKSKAYELIPHELAVTPFGVGLGTVGAVGGFGGHVQNQINGHEASAETQYNFVVDELGGPGLAVWVALSLYIVVFVGRGIRRVRDNDLAIMLAAFFAPFAALIITGFSGPFMTSSAHGPYFWFAIGTAAYWFAGPGRKALRSNGRSSSSTVAAPRQVAV